MTEGAGDDVQRAVKFGAGRAERGRAMRATLDTCGLVAALQRGDPEALRLIRQAFEHRVAICVSPRVRAEVEQYENKAVRDQTLHLLHSFPVAGTAKSVAEDPELVHVGRILERAIPGGAPSPEKVREDALHLVTHIRSGGEVFVTNDRRILAASSALSSRYRVECLTPGQLADRIDAAEVSPIPPATRDAFIEVYGDSRREGVQLLLRPLAPLYPGFDQWLARTLSQVQEGQARCHLGTIGDRVAGVCISKRKGPHTAKLCTLFVARDLQRSGLGHHLLQWELDYWAGQRLHELYLTMPDALVTELLSFYEAHGFLSRGFAPDRYREGSVEYVLSKRFAYGAVADADVVPFLRDSNKTLVARS